MCDTLGFASCKWEVPFDGRHGQFLKVFEIVRFAKEVNWDKLADKTALELPRSLHCFNKLQANLFDVNVRLCPVGEFDKEPPWYLHIKDVKHTIAFLFDLCNFVFQAFSHIPISFFCLCSSCSTVLYYFFDFSALHRGFFDLFLRNNNFLFHFFLSFLFYFFLNFFFFLVFIFTYLLALRFLFY